METISLARGVPAAELLPLAELADCTTAVLDRDAAALLSYGAPAGYAPLREWVAARHGVDAERVLLTNGSLQGLALLAVHLLRGASRRVVVEAPTYDRPLALLSSFGAQVTAVPVDGDGLDVDAVEAALDGGSGDPPAFLYTIPTFQNPSGVTLALDRRKRLAALARDGRVLVVEDDPYSLVRLDGEPLPSLFELAAGEGVIYASSFSKTLAPGLRTGYLIVPKELAQPITRLAASTYVSPLTLTEAVVHEVVSRGLHEPALERIRAGLRPRRDALLHALERHFSPEARWSRPDGGYFVWLDLPPTIASDALLEAAAAAGVTFVRGSDFFPGGAGGQHAARLAYSAATPAALEEAVARLRRAVDRVAGNTVAGQPVAV